MDLPGKRSRPGRRIVRAGGWPGAARMHAAARRDGALDYGSHSRPGYPSSDELLSLSGGEAQLRKRIQGRIQRNEAIENSPEQVSAAAGKGILIQVNVYSRSGDNDGPGSSNEVSQLPSGFHAKDARDLRRYSWRASEVERMQEAAQNRHPVLIER